MKAKITKAKMIKAIFICCLLMSEEKVTGCFSSLHCQAYIKLGRPRFFASAADRVGSMRRWVSLLIRDKFMQDLKRIVGNPGNFAVT